MLRDNLRKELLSCPQLVCVCLGRGVRTEDTGDSDREKATRPITCICPDAEAASVVIMQQWELQNERSGNLELTMFCHCIDASQFTFS